MLGVIVGDIIGSTREGRKSLFDDKGLIYGTEKNATVTHLPSPEPILHERLSFTDDTVLMLATERALREVGDERANFAKHYVDFFDMHSEPNAFYKGKGIGYGSKFMEWATARLNGDNRPGYHSYGNGSAMRIAPVAYHFNSLLPMLNVARASAACTHNHLKGIEGAQVMALAIFAARMGASPSCIRTLVEDNSEYQLEFDEEKLVSLYYFQPTCEGSVPQALWAALEGPDFISVMRRCLRIGGDTDTIAAMAGSLAEVLYGIPEDIAEMALQILKRDGPFLYNEYCLAIKSCNNYYDYPNVRELPANMTNEELPIESRSVFKSLLSLFRK